MPKPKGPSVFPTGKFPVELNEGVGQRQFFPGTPGPSKGVQVYPEGKKFGTPDNNDPTRPYNPPMVSGKGPQVARPTRFGDTTNQNQDPSRPYNP